MDDPFAVVAGIPDPAAQAAAGVLSAAGLPVRVLDSTGPDEIAAVGANARALIVRGARVDADLLDRLPRLGLVVSVRPADVDVDAAEARGVWLAGPRKGESADRHASQALSLVLAQVRRVDADHCTLTGTPRGAHERTLGVIGMGRVGSRVARLAGPMFGRVVGTDPRAHPWRAPAERMDLDALLAASDAISLHVPLTDSTRALIDTATIARMRPGAIVVNLADHALVRREAMLTALHSGRIAGFGSGPTRPFDAHAAEPCPLRSHPSVLIAPDRPAKRRADHRIDHRLEDLSRLALNVVSWHRNGIPLDPAPRPA
ncbi:D-3-phosphoglycerate dehydrogenase [Murinocardiopsis flavida]|uniref:D-3-phosphoglycerate dehydrogenase n=1 Tax=Murinocardiopsis flavida TaxID=645275 RepID=A0A2P8DHA3_9ACTN|nr:NAD(P)-dependent oxidoreductase [Murinocardiopsis flavida]PSK96600.1 D-3-phosphoglycerate dehydrogenase [Murinocardiopsis flavida]